MDTLDVLVIGAGQAGLSAASHLVRKGLRPGREVVVLDAGEGPGGAWRDRWDSLTFDAAHGIADLPGQPLGRPDPDEPASAVVARYYGSYEQRLQLAVERPVRVVGTRRVDGLFTTTADDGRSWRSRTVVNATGTWNSPYVPHYPGIESFTGRQLHTRGYVSAGEFAGQRVLVVGGGASAAQFVLDLGRAGVETVWSTRTTPRWTDRSDNPDWGVDVEAAVGARTRAGLAPLSVVAATGLDLNQMYLPWVRDGRLLSRGPLLRILPDAVVLDGPGPDGSGLVGQGLADPHAGTPARLPGAPAEDSPTAWRLPVDVILWATGFRAHLDHLAPLGIREHGGGILMADDGVSVVRHPGLFLVGYGASASTIGATRAGRRAAVGAVRLLADEGQRPTS